MFEHFVSERSDTVKNKSPKEVLFLKLMHCSNHVEEVQFNYIVLYNYN